MLISSSVGDDILAHTLEDTLKNLKHGSDSLASILCDYKDYSVNTAKKIVVLTRHIIQNKMTTLKYSPGPSGKWSVIEARSCTIPLKYEKRMNNIKLYEMFAFIYASTKETSHFTCKSAPNLDLMVADIEGTRASIRRAVRRKTWVGCCSRGRHGAQQFIFSLGLIRNGKATIAYLCL